MNKEKVVVVDYGLGNLFSVQRALEHCGASNVCITSSPADIISADRLILPGVGAFKDGILGLNNLGLVESIKSYVLKKQPLLGICLGMQMLATRSHEFGETQGLCLIDGDVIPIPSKTLDGERLKIPHIGWVPLHPGQNSSWSGTVLQDLPLGGSVYLVHSFHMKPTNSNAILATATYGGHEITAAIQRENVIGCQFHPEKSGENGLQLLRRFLAL